MKIVKEDCVYVQRSDIAYLFYYDEAIPMSVYEKSSTEGSYSTTERNSCEFIRFDKPDEIEFFKSLSWSIDFLEVKDLSEKEIIALGEEVVNERNAIIALYSGMLPGSERREKLELKSELLYCKFCSLRDILRWRQGRVKIEFPEGIVENTTPVIQEEKTTFQRIRGLFKKNK